MKARSMSSTAFRLEAIIQEAQCCLLPLRKSNFKRPVEPWVHSLQASHWKVIEVTGSMIEKLLPKLIDEGVKIISESTRIGQTVIIRTPIEMDYQVAAFGNAFERHLSLWTEKLLRSMGADEVFNGEDLN